MGSISVGYLLLHFNGNKTGSNCPGSSGSNTAAATTWPELHLLLASLALDQKSKLSHTGTTGMPVIAVVPVVLAVSHQWFQRCLWSRWSPPVVPGATTTHCAVVKLCLCVLSCMSDCICQWSDTHKHICTYKRQLPVCPREPSAFA